MTEQTTEIQTTSETYSASPKRGWSAERRAKHAASIRRWAPWTKSTGPRTVQGKTRSAQNARKHGMRDATMRYFASVMARNNRFVRLLAAYDRYKTQYPANELLKTAEKRLQTEQKNINTTLLCLLERLTYRDQSAYARIHDG
jgi:hypothetical protein